MLTILGTTTVDVFVRGINRLPWSGDDEFSNNSLVWLDHEVTPVLGGNGANTAYASAALGESVRLWSAVGGDPFGDMALRWLGERGVATGEMLVDRAGGTACTVILTDRGLRRNSFHHPGPIERFVPQGAAGKPRDWLLITGYHLLAHLRGQPTVDILRDARQRGVRTALDIGPILGAPAGKGEMEALLPYVDLLLLNEFELGEVAGLDLEGGIRWAFEAGAGQAVLKTGRRGAVVFKAAGERIDVPAFRVDVEGTVGAGDSFDAGFLYRYSRGSTLKDSARFANAVAAIVVSSKRGILDAPGVEQAETFLAQAKQNTAGGATTVENTAER